MQVLAVPVKPLERAKGRLSTLLTPLERAVLTLAMLEDVLDACLVQPAWETWVVSADEAVLEVGARRGARPFPEPGRTLLGALALVEPAIRGRSSALGVVLADLPLLTPDALAAALSVPAPVVAAPAGSDGGTNLLVRRPPRVIPSRFGRDSFGRHRWAARRARVPFGTAEAPELAFDLDRPADIAVLLRSPGGRRTVAACQDLDLPARLRQRA
jgi:2-phospho-L-lactate guanylyltransferase